MKKLETVPTEKLLEELARRGWTLRNSTTGRYKRAVIEDWYKKEKENG